MQRKQKPTRISTSFSNPLSLAPWQGGKFAKQETTSFFLTSKCSVAPLWWKDVYAIFKPSHVLGTCFVLLRFHYVFCLHLILPRARYWAIISTWDRHGIFDIGGMTASMGGICWLVGFGPSLMEWAFSPFFGVFHKVQIPYFYCHCQEWFMLYSPLMVRVIITTVLSMMA